MIMMKRLPLLFLYFLLTAGVASGNSYFSIGNNDTIWVNPNKVINGKTVPVHAHFEGRVDQWFFSFNYPDSVSTYMHPSLMTEAGDMNIPYINSVGDTTVFSAVLLSNAPYYTQASANNWQQGYWYDNGILVSYGTVKWEAGDYEHMFDIKYQFDAGFHGGAFSIDGHMTCSTDMRGGMIPTQPIYKVITVVIGCMLGDVNCDDRLTIDDLTALINYLLNPDAAAWDEYQIAAADVDGNGSVGINDLTSLTNLIMSQG